MGDNKEQDWNIYDVATSMIIQGASKKDAIRNAIFFVLEKGDKEEIISNLGIDAYIDYMRHSEEARKLNFAYFVEEFDTIIPEMRKQSSKYKLNEIKEAFGSSGAKEIITGLISEKLRKEHFPISSLESTLIANGMSHLISKKRN